MSKEIKAAWISGICVIIAAIIGVFSINIHIENNEYPTEVDVSATPIDSETTFSELVTVPDVENFSQEEAVSILESSNLNFQVFCYEEDIGDTYYVAEQFIPANSKVEAGTIIKLRLVAY